MSQMVKSKRSSNKPRENKLFAKRKNDARESVVFVRSPVVADRMYVRLRAVIGLSLGSGAASYSTVAYPGNAPNGLEPVGYTEWGNFYGKQRTHASHLTLTGSNGTAGSSILCEVHPSAAVFAGVPDLGAQEPYSRWVVAGQLGSKNDFILKNSMTTKKILGLKSIEYEEDLASALEANPATLWYWDFTYSSIGGAAVGVAIQFVFTIEYDIEFYERLDLSAS